MKKLFLLMLALGLLSSACGAAPQPAAVPPTQAVVAPSPVTAVDLNATAAAMSQQTLQAMPTPTLAPSNTPVVLTETPVGTATPTSSPTVQVTATETQNPILLTLTATLGTGTPVGTQATIMPFESMQPAATAETGSAPTGTEYPRTYGTMPPSLPAATLFLINDSNKEATISLHCTAKNGTTTIIEYPVAGTIKIKAPAGKYHYVVWVGGKRYTGDFNLPVGADGTVIIYKDGVKLK